MITIKPVTVAEISARFATSRGGGNIPKSSWIGSARFLLPVTEPAPLRELLCVFNGYSPDAKMSLIPEPQEKADWEGWSIHVQAPVAVRNLWTVSSERTRQKVEHGHQLAVSTCLYELERSFQGPGTQQPKAERRGVLFAMVQQNPEMQKDPWLETDAFMPNLHLSLNQPAQRCPPFQLRKTANELNEVYKQNLFDWLGKSMGLEYVNERGIEPTITGVPLSLILTSTTAEKRPRTLETLQRTVESLKFEEWQGQAKKQGWGPADAEALVKRAAERVSPLATLEKSDSPVHELLTAETNFQRSHENETEKHKQRFAMTISN